METADRREPILTVTDALDRQPREAIGAALSRLDEAKTGIKDHRPLAVVVADPETREVLGGLARGGPPRPPFPRACSVLSLSHP
jgi:hypothetical protein